MNVKKDPSCKASCQCPSDPKKSIVVEEQFEESAFLQFFLKYGKIFTWGFVALFVIAVWGFSKTSSKGKESERDYFYAQAAAESLQKSAPFSQASLDELRLLVEKHPILHAKYDALIAQCLLATGKAEDAALYARQALRNHPEIQASVFGEYARTTQQIAAGNFTDALQAALDLKLRLQKDPSYQTVYKNLYFANLLRLAALYRQQNLPMQEIEALLEIKQSMGNPESTAMCSKEIVQLFHTGAITLEDYIESRMGDGHYQINPS